MAFQLHFADPDPRQAPDTVERVPQLGVDPEYVISRDKAGNLVSTFSQNTWDCRMYGAPSTFNFDTWWSEKTKGPMDSLALKLTVETKTIFWLCMFETTSNAGRSRGVSYLHQLQSILRAIAKIAHTLGITLAEAHNNTQFQVALRSSIANADKGLSNHTTLTGLFKDIAYWQGVKTIDCEVPRLIPEDDLSDLLAQIQKYKQISDNKREQCALVPTRLFGKMISGALENLHAVQPYLESLEAYIKAIQSNPRFCVDKPKDYHNNVDRVKRLYPNLILSNKLEANERYLSTVETIELFGLSNYPQKVGLENLKLLDGHLTQLQIYCVILIHAFSGMRTSEVQVMPFEPIVHSVAKGFGDLPVLVSHLKKFAKKGHYSRPLVWATAKEGVYAVEIAQKVASLKWFRKHPAQDELPNDIPLFIGNDTRSRSTNNHYRLPISSVLFSSNIWAFASQSLGLIIEEEDLEELRVFDAFRAWDESPDFDLGKVWPLSSHQIRRSVAVYASRSGMVSLPALKTQFKHLSEAMTALYSENSSYAQNFLIDKNGKPIENGSVLISFRDAITLNTSVRFHEQVIQSEKQLRGPIGTQIQRAKDQSSLPRIFESREETQKAIKQGRFSFKETPVGGCVLKGSCPHFAIDLVLPCTSGCEHAILKPEKLETYIESLRFDLATISPKSRPYELITKEINFIESTYLKPAETE